MIKQLDLTIEDGQFFTFVGPSGCGKSTILNMIAGLEDVSGGTIWFDGMEVNRLSPGDRDVAMVFQSYALYPHMNVFENIAFPLRMQKAEKACIRQEVKRVAALLGMEDLLARKPRELSGGQKQRVALGRAIIRHPRVFLMDEPLSNLDARLRIDMRTELKRLHRELNITTVYVTHDQAEALALSDRIAILDRGEIQQCGTPFDVYDRPANVFAGSFIGSPPMNLLSGVLRETDPPTIDCTGMILAPSLGQASPGKRVIVGVRPEDVLVATEDGDGAEVIISVVEPAGSRNWVDVLWNGLTIKGISGALDNLKEGQKASMKISSTKVVVFDAETERRL